MFLQKPQLKYTDDPELNLTIIALKKLINEYTKENQILKKLNLNYEQKELEQKIQLKQLSAHIEELEIEQKLLASDPSDNIKFDLEDLDSRLE